MTEIIKAIFFGIVEGITEWLPISSTGHMILLDEFIKLDVSAGFYSMFQVVIQLGAILAVVVYFWSTLWPFAGAGNTDPLAKSGPGRYVRKGVFELWLHIIVSCIPAVIVGVLFDELFERLFYNYVTVALMLIIFGVAFIAVENRQGNRDYPIKSIGEISYKTALLIGLFQVIAAVFPGSSRSGTTIVGSLLIGVARPAAAEYTFCLAVPVMFGASLLKLLKFGLSFTGTELAVLLTGMAVAFVVSLLVIRFIMGYVRKHDFKVFGWYRIALGIVVLLCGILGIIG